MIGHDVLGRARLRIRFDRNGDAAQAKTVLLDTRLLRRSVTTAFAPSTPTKGTS
jgi:hypothetical protein